MYIADFCSWPHFHSILQHCYITVDLSVIKTNFSRASNLSSELVAPGSRPSLGQENGSEYLMQGLWPSWSFNLEIQRKKGPRGRGKSGSPSYYPSLSNDYSLYPDDLHRISFYSVYILACTCLYWCKHFTINSGRMRGNIVIDSSVGYLMLVTSNFRSCGIQCWCHWYLHACNIVILTLMLMTQWWQMTEKLWLNHSIEPSMIMSEAANGNETLLLVTLLPVSPTSMYSLTTVAIRIMAMIF